MKWIGVGVYPSGCMLLASGAIIYLHAGGWLEGIQLEHQNYPLPTTPDWNLTKTSTWHCIHLFASWHCCPGTKWKVALPFQKQDHNRRSIHKCRALGRKTTPGWTTVVGSWGCCRHTNPGERWTNQRQFWSLWHGLWGRSWKHQTTNIRHSAQAKKRCIEDYSKAHLHDFFHQRRMKDNTRLREQAKRMISHRRDSHKINGPVSEEEEQIVLKSLRSGEPLTLASWPATKQLHGVMMAMNSHEPDHTTPDFGASVWNFWRLPCTKRSRWKLACPRLAWHRSLASELPLEQRHSFFGNFGNFSGIVFESNWDNLRYMKCVSFALYVSWNVGTNW